MQLILHHVMLIILLGLEGKYFCDCKHRQKNQFSPFYQSVTGAVHILKMQFEFNFREESS